jgi:galactose-1-phosphate uridylyltransferase
MRGFMPHTLHRMKLIGEIDIHSDILSVAPSALSSKRALKVGAKKQQVMEDPDGEEKCIMCDPHNNKKRGTSTAKPMLDEPIKGRVAGFENDFPYMPKDQWVHFMWHEDIKVRHRAFHQYMLKDLKALELYWLFKACISKGKDFVIPRESTDTWRMVCGMNLGNLAGQSIPHFHMQYGWEVALNPKHISKPLLELYFSELEEQDLIIHENEQIKLVSPWTPKGQYAIELYFKGKYDMMEMTEKDIKIFAIYGSKIIERYVQLGIQNLNIVFTNSPQERQTEPLIVNFVPRANVPALYEIKGVNVVDTSPTSIAVEFRRFNTNTNEGFLWQDIDKDVEEYDPEEDYNERIAGAK